MVDSGPPGPNQYQFDDLTIDTGKRLVLRDTSALEISGLTYDLLLAIVQAAPNIISSDELVEKVWAGRPTSPETITQRAMMLRQGLGDSADAPRYIEVVRGQGFRLIPQISNAAPTASKPSRPIRMRYMIAAVIAFVAIFVFDEFIGTSTQDSSTESAPIRRFALDLGDLQGIGQSGVQAELTLSPNGKNIAYSAVVGNELQRIYVRSLDQFESTPLSGTEGARHPFFSPDGEWIGFDVQLGSRILKISTRGGPVQEIIDGTQRMYGASWGKDGSIIYSTASQSDVLGGRLMKVSAAGGVAEEVLAPDDEHAFVWPQHLPDGDSVLFTIRKKNGNATDGSIAVLSLATMQYRTLIASAFNARYAPTGHLVFARQGALWAAPFDLKNLTVTGTETPLVDELQVNTRLGGAIYDFSNDGLLVYLRGSTVSYNIQGLRRPLWVDRQGKEFSIDAESRSYFDPSLSPDGSKLAVRVNDESPGDVWVLDLERGNMNRLTFHAAFDGDPQWSPDGEQLYFSSIRNDGAAVYVKSADGTGEARLVSSTNVAPRIDAITPDGKKLILLTRIGGPSDIYTLSTTGESAPQPFMATQFDEDHAAISPDGKYVAYEGSETGRAEIYVRTYPNLDGGKWQISTDGGNEPIWGPDGNELFFRDNETGWISIVDIEKNSSSFGSPPRVIVRGDYYNNSPSYDISPDGTRFLMFKNEEQSGTTDEIVAERTKLAVVENWFEELKRITPTETSK